MQRTKVTEQTEIVYKQPQLRFEVIRSQSGLDMKHTLGEMNLFSLL